MGCPPPPGDLLRGSESRGSLHTLAGPSWPTLLRGALEHFRVELALPATTLLRAEPHALLVYGRDQFPLDHWYRRAAVVVWPRERAFAARGEAGPRWALEELQSRIERGDLDGARASAPAYTATGLPFPADPLVNTVGTTGFEPATP
ncbi:hypothetical protein [Streptomyces gilvus]|uniref:hypothetical protein n=1 Tax=Streptomyces gilvus TaxID=2920937 RepID=UPI001F0E64E4|nr:hypothetical protein [Streptomyces sp. CME 23]MCH5670839.1 hypothetical protein [Streptomyces sp. CME 23]